MAGERLAQSPPLRSEQLEALDHAPLALGGDAHFGHTSVVAGVTGGSVERAPGSCLPRGVLTSATGENGDHK